MGVCPLHCLDPWEVEEEGEETSTPAAKLAKAGNSVESEPVCGWCVV